MVPSYIPLLAVQGRSHSLVYQSPARQFSSTADIVASSRAVAARLRGATQKAVAVPDQMDEFPILENAPLNMLTPCSWRFLVRLAGLRKGLSASEVMCRSRRPHIVAARTDALALVYRHTQHSLPGVGQLFSLDHTTVIHALHKTGSTSKLVETRCPD